MDEEMPAFLVENIKPSFGSIVRDFAVSGDVSKRDFDALMEVFLDRHLLVIPTSGIEPLDQVAFSRLFGPLEIHAETRFILKDHPEVIRIGNATENGEPCAAFSIGVEQWHSDSSYRPSPSIASLFYAEIVPPTGGDTLFADAISAYEGLPSATKSRIDGLHAVHDYEYFDRWLKVINEGRPPYSDEKRRKFPPHSQPIVRVHPATGVKSLLVCPAVISHIEGMSPSESRLLLDALTAFATQDRYVYRHEWTVGDLVIWDNLCTLHTATSFDHTKHTRLMRRTTVTSYGGSAASPPPSAA
jgi:alpha-ketoglutarate-dependent taurine dioxygenase